MSMRFFRIILAILVVTSIPLVTHAKEPNSTGLAVAPVRQEMTVVAGKLTQGAIRVANYTDDKLTVNLSVQQFSAIDYVYDYQFTTPVKDWIVFEKTYITLGPGQDKKVNFTVNAPNTTSPGGYYFALFASADMSGAVVKRVARVTSLLYLSVDGKLTRTGSITDDIVPFFVYDSTIPYTFNVKNTGNVHYGAFFYGQLEGFFYDQPRVGVGHVLLPGTIRAVGGSIPAPFFPGLYKMTYGYKTDVSDNEVVKTTYIIYIPPWSLAALVLVLFIIKWFWQNKRARHRHKS